MLRGRQRWNLVGETIRAAVGVRCDGLGLSKIRRNRPCRDWLGHWVHFVGRDLYLRRTLDAIRGG